MTSEEQKARQKMARDKYRASHRDELNAKYRAAYAADPEPHREYARQYRKDHPERHTAQTRKWIERNPDRNKNTRAKYYRDNISKSMWINARSRAKRRGLEFTISESDISVPTQCPVLGIEIKVGQGNPTDNSPTLDRIDTSRGYVPGNVSVISYRANRIKNDSTPEELRLLADHYAPVSDWRDYA